MSWSRRSLLLAALVAAGCGFTPALAPEGPADKMRGDFEINAPFSPSGFYLTRELERRLGLPSGPTYNLQLAIIEGAQVTGIPPDRVTARANLLGRVEYTVTHIPSGEVVRRGAVRSFTGLSATSTTAATRAALEDAQRRLMTILADRVVADLLATSADWRR